MKLLQRFCEVSTAVKGLYIGYNKGSIKFSARERVWSSAEMSVYRAKAV